MTLPRHNPAAARWLTAPSRPCARPPSGAARLSLAAACVASGLLGALAHAQQESPPPAAPAPRATPPELEPYQGRPVRVITLRLASGEAPDKETDSFARIQLRLREGAPFDADLVSRDISSLNRAGRFARVECHVQLLDDGSVELIYTLALQPLITSVQSVGNRLFSDQQLAASIDALVGTPVDRTQLDRACRRIEDRYREKGYYNALVAIDEKELTESGIVLFKIREGERTRITDIRFDGNVTVAPAQLEGVIKSERANIIKEGQIDDELLAQDVASIIEYYRDRGYIDVRVDRYITVSPDGREAIITFRIEEGPVYTLRGLSIIFEPEDRGVFSEAQLMGLMSIKTGDVFAEKKLKESMDLIKTAYGKLGYPDAEVRRREPREPDQPLVDILLIVSEGRRFRTGVVEVKGNSITRDDVVRRFVTIQPDRPLDSAAAAETERRLRQSNLFTPGSAKVTIQPEKPGEPGYRDVLVEVEETNTGSLGFGAGISSDSGLTLSASITQRNFDITDTPDTFGELFSTEAFRGGGQTFKVELVPGVEQSIYSVSLSDPYLFETDYSGSASAYYRDREFDDYDEKRVGTRLSVGRRFGSRWNASIPFKLENVSLSDIAPDAPTDYFAVGEDRVVNSIGVSISRSSVDNAAFPSRGNRVSIGVDQFGLLGDDDFTDIHADYSVYIPIVEDPFGRSTTLNFTTKTGYIPGDRDVAPFFERYFLGGQTFRGFDFRGVGPPGVRADNGGVSEESVGGNFMFFAGLELRQPLYEELLSGILFIDTGTVEEEISFDNYRVSVGFGFRVYLQQLSPVPLAFDFGFPLVKEDTDDERLFTFTVDVPFN